MVSAALSYFKIAAHFNIIDQPNKRSSHNIPTIRGGGILFSLSLLLFFLWNNFAYPYLFLAVLISAIISFVDDILIVNNLLKFLIHVIAAFLIFKECQILTSVPIWYLLALAIIIIGIINAYNFMDGINGITGLYSIVLVFTLCITEINAQLQSLQIFIIIGLLVFLYFNARKKARCFAGDVGSISMAIIIIFLLLTRIQQTSNYIYIGLLLLYGIDSIYTILQRLYQKENIFKPHRKHLYQYYCNEKNIPHIYVSGIYAALQLIISLAIVYNYVSYISLLIIFIFVSTVYWILKIPLIKAYDFSKSAPYSKL